MAVMMSPSEDFNAIVAIELRTDLGHGHVYEFALDTDAASLQLPTTGVDILGGDGLTLAELQRGLADGGRLELRTVESADHQAEPAGIPLFLVGANGDLHGASDAGRTPEPGEQLIELVAPGPRVASAGRDAAPSLLWVAELMPPGSAPCSSLPKSPFGCGSWDTAASGFRGGCRFRRR